MIVLANRLKNQTSPYLIQHAENPVNWFPWGEEAFEKAKKEDKPIFLSIGYSTCHWCHVMANESFEDKMVAKILNDHFVSIKVDKEERPDIDSIYMSVCIAFTGSGGWPTTIFMTPNQKPFFAGTYFPKTSSRGMVGFIELLLAISEKWETNRQELIQSANQIVAHIENTPINSSDPSEELITTAISQYQNSFDEQNGGFLPAPKFPSAHNLLFLLEYFRITKQEQALYMAEKTLTQLYKGGIFDHIGYGFSRYSTDQYFLVPHFEKMLYDNALLLLAYTKAYAITHKALYKSVAEKTATYILRELTNEHGAFYSAQDADSDGVEGKYYVFSYRELIDLLGEDVGKRFNEHYGISKNGNFEGSNIPNLLFSRTDENFESVLPKIYEYRKNRTSLHLDDKVLTAWNALMIAAFASMYATFQEEKYLDAAKKAYRFIEEYLSDRKMLFVSYRKGVTSGKGFLDDYAFLIYALITLYEATLEKQYLTKAYQYCDQVNEEFYDAQNGGYFLYGTQNEQLIIKPKETYDGAMPSGNSVMAFNLVKLSALKKDERLQQKADRQLAFMAAHASSYPSGFSFYLQALLLSLYPQKSVVCVLKSEEDFEILKQHLPINASITVLEKETSEYQLINDRTTYYICEDQTCYPPTNHIERVIL